MSYANHGFICLLQFRVVSKDFTVESCNALTMAPIKQ